MALLCLQTNPSANVVRTPTGRGAGIEGKVGRYRNIVLYRICSHNYRNLTKISVQLKGKPIFILACTLNVGREVVFFLVLTLNLGPKYRFWTLIESDDFSFLVVTKFLC